MGMSFLARLDRLAELLRDDPSGLPLRDRRRLAGLPRYTPSTATIAGTRVRLEDAASFLVDVEEIFRRRVYDFVPAGASPRILDCGANIGLATIWLKLRFPGACVTAFEPDPALCDALRANVAAFAFAGVEVRQQAVWTAATTLEFVREGAHSGRVATGGEPGPRLAVAAVRLRDLLAAPVDLLKLDVEGAETEILRDCAGALGAVRTLFVEYHSRADTPQTLQEILALLAGAGFRYHVTPAQVAARPFVARPLSQGFDLQLNVYAFRA
jgi:FkbM family methyltransferase